MSKIEGYVLPIVSLIVGAILLSGLIMVLKYTPAFSECNIKEEVVEELSIQAWVFTRLEEEFGIDEAINGIIIVQCESRFDPDILGDTYDMGLWQINRQHQDISNADKFDYKKATEWSIEKFKKDGTWSAWVCAELRGIN